MEIIFNARTFRSVPLIIVVICLFVPKLNAQRHVASFSGGTLSGPQSVFVSGNHAYVGSGGNSSLVIVDVTNPAFPVFKGSVEVIMRVSFS